MAIFQSLFQQELRLLWHSGFFLIVILLAAFFVLIINFIIPSFTKLLLLAIILETIILGFFFAAVTTYREKSEETIKAFRVSPAGIWHYVLSKAAADVLLSILYGFLIVFFSMGAQADYGRLLLIIIPASFLVNVLGQIIGANFRSLSSFIYAAALSAVILILPVFTYFFPSFQPDFFRLIPSYGLLSGLQEVLFPNGRDVFFFWQPVMSLTAEAFIMTLLSYWVLERKLMN